MSQREKVVLITGAARRIGANMAQLFHNANYRVVIHYNRSASDADKLCQQLNDSAPDSCLMIQANLSSPSGIKKITDLINSIGRLDVLINNASSFYPTPLENCDQDQWDDLIGSNLRGPFFLTQALAGLLKKQRGAVVNISDMHARQALANHPISVSYTHLTLPTTPYV